jgi:hypothetical protein
MESPPTELEKKMDTPFEDSSSTNELWTTQEGVTATYEAKSTLSKHPFALDISPMISNYLVNEHVQNEYVFRDRNHIVLSSSQQDWIWSVPAPTILLNWLGLGCR